MRCDYCDPEAMAERLAGCGYITLPPEDVAELRSLLAEALASECPGKGYLYEIARILALSPEPALI